MSVFGSDYTRDQVLKHIGRVSQLGGTRHYVLNEGSGKGTAAIDINIGS